MHVMCTTTVAVQMQLALECSRTLQYGGRLVLVIGHQAIHIYGEKSGIACSERHYNSL